MIRIYKAAMLLIAAVSLNAFAQTDPDFYLGADLSFVNELQDTGVKHYDGGTEKNAYDIFKDKGSNLWRFRIWYHPLWTEYSTFEDVTRSLQEAKNRGVETLVSIQYSDEWADPGNQHAPHAWSHITNVTDLASEVYSYTYGLLDQWHTLGVLPNFVQIGNETNINVALLPNESYSMPPVARNAEIFNAGLNAVDQFNSVKSTNVKKLIHIAGLRNAEWWMSLHHEFVNNYDVMGVSYYPNAYSESIPEVGEVISAIKATYGKDVMLVETGSPWMISGENGDNANNMFGSFNIPIGYDNPPTELSQRKYLIDLAYTVKEAGGLGVVYWEPAWVKNEIWTLFGQGSAWENTALFDYSNNANAAFDFYSYDYGVKPNGLDPVSVAVQVDMTGIDQSNGVFIEGEFSDWEMVAMSALGDNLYEYQTNLTPNTKFTYRFSKTSDTNDIANIETVPTPCNKKDNFYRKYIVDDQVNSVSHTWEGCVSGVLEDRLVEFQLSVPGVDDSNGIYITGNFNGWVIEPMTKAVENFYTYQTEIPYGEAIEYYYLNGPTWADKEVFLATDNWCLDNNNRVYDINDSVSWKIPVKGYFGECDGYTARVELTINADMTGIDVSQGVYITGEWANWANIPMTLTSTNIYTAEVAFNSESENGGNVESFFFRNGTTSANEEIIPAACKASANEGFGRRIVVPNGSSEYTYNWGSCAEEEVYTNMTFDLDVIGVASSDTYYVTGSFSQWQIIQMTDEGDGHFTHTASVKLGTSGQYYYLNSTQWEDKEQVPAGCAGLYAGTRNYNAPRISNGNFVYSDLWSRCNTERDNIPLTFNLTLDTPLDSGDSIFVNGEFSNWSFVEMTMTDSLNYEATITSEMGHSGTYSYYLNKSWTKESLPVGCLPEKVEAGGFRMFQVTTEEATSIHVDVYETCDAAP